MYFYNLMSLKRNQLFNFMLYRPSSNLHFHECVFKKLCFLSNSELRSLVVNLDWHKIQLCVFLQQLLLVTNTLLRKD